MPSEGRRRSRSPRPVILPARRWLDSHPVRGLACGTISLIQKVAITSRPWNSQVLEQITARHSYWISGALT
jgi:hypothetical protein